MKALSAEISHEHKIANVRSTFAQLLICRLTGNHVNSTMISQMTDPRHISKGLLFIGQCNSQRMKPRVNLKRLLSAGSFTRILIPKVCGRHVEIRVGHLIRT